MSTYIGITLIEYNEINQVFFTTSSFYFTSNDWFKFFSICGLPLLLSH